MKLLHRFASCLLVLSLSSPLLLAQADKPLENIPLEVRTADQLSDVYKKEIQKYISDWVEILKDNSNPQQQSTARDKLTGAAMALGAQNASVGYRSFYASTLNNALMPLTKSPDMRIRLLAGIVAGRVAERVNNTELADVALALVNDKTDPVVIWGMRTARYVMPWLLRNPAVSSPLPKAIVTAVSNHPSVPVATDAYRAFALPEGAPNAAIVQGAIDTLDLLSARINQYERVLPFDPTADSIGTTYLSIRAWPVLDASQRLQTVQEISDLISVMAQRAAVEDHSKTPEIIDGIQPVAAAIYVIGSAEQATALVNAVKPLAQKRFTPQTTAQELQSVADPIYPALKAVPDFAQIKPPPSIAAGASATSQPTTQQK